MAPFDMMIRWWNSPTYGLAFLGIPKCGSSSTRKMLGMDPDDWLEQPVPGLIKFTVLRHPLTRAFSAYHECRRRKTFPFGPWRDTFEEFIAALAWEGFFDEHTAPMSHYMQPVDKVAILELGLRSQLCDLAGVTHLPDAFENPTQAMWGIPEGMAPTLLELYADDMVLYDTAFQQALAPVCDG